MESSTIGCRPSSIAESVHPNILNRDAAKARLITLKPGCREHQQLQHALSMINGIVEIVLPNNSYKVNTAEPVLIGGFGPSEHLAIGEALKIKGLENDNPPLLLMGARKTALHFGDIVALAGDFYGFAGEAISLPGGGDEAKTDRFVKALRTLLEADHNQVRRIKNEIRSEHSSMSHSGLPCHCYISQLMGRNKTIKEIKPDTEELLINNSDHFFTEAIDTYRIGHSHAMSVAREAGRAENVEKKIEGLKHAYVIDAFACHFLSDLFSSGHARNHRGRLEKFLINQIKFSSDKAKPLAGLLAAAQHEHDGREGLNVSNALGEVWRAYGDGSYFQPRSGDNRVNVIKAVQLSVDEVFNSYNRPDVGVCSSVADWIPRVTEHNPPPVYTVNEACSELTLYGGSEAISIKDRKDYLTGAVPHALRFLPEAYVSAYVDQFLGIPDLDKTMLGKVIMPQYERLTGTLWHLFGIATYHQVKDEGRFIKEKVDEMANGLKSLIENTELILKKLNDVQQTLAEQLREGLFKEFRDAVGVINSVKDEFFSYSIVLTKEQRESAIKRLWEAHNLIGSILERGETPLGKPLLPSYQAMLEEDPELNPEEVKLKVTLWFRQMIQCQIDAFRLYGALRMLNDEANTYQQQIPRFEAKLLRQIDANRQFISLELIYEPECYIQLQLETARILT